MDPIEVKISKSEPKKSFYDRWDLHWLILLDRSPEDIVAILRKNHNLLFSEFKSHETSRNIDHSLWDMMLLFNRRKIFIAVSELAKELVQSGTIDRVKLFEKNVNSTQTLLLASIMGDEDVFDFCVNYLIDLRLVFPCFNDKSITDHMADLLISRGIHVDAKSSGGLTSLELIVYAISIDFQKIPDDFYLHRSIFLLEHNATLSDPELLRCFGKTIDHFVRNIDILSKIKNHDDQTRQLLTERYAKYLYLRGLIAEQCEKNFKLAKPYYELAGEYGHVSSYLRIVRHCCELNEFWEVYGLMRLASTTMKRSGPMPLKKSYDRWDLYMLVWDGNQAETMLRMLRILSANPRLLFVVYPPNINTYPSCEHSLWDLMLAHDQTEMFIAVSYLAKSLIANKTIKKADLAVANINLRNAAKTDDRVIFEFCVDYLTNLQTAFPYLDDNLMDDDRAAFLVSHGINVNAKDRQGLTSLEKIVDILDQYEKAHFNLGFPCFYIDRSIFLLEHDATLLDPTRLQCFINAINACLSGFYQRILDKIDIPASQRAHTKYLYLRGLIAEQCEKNFELAQEFYLQAGQQGHVSSYLRIAHHCCGLNRFQEAYRWLSAACEINPSELIPLKRSEVGIAIQLVAKLKGQSVNDTQRGIRETLITSLSAYAHDRLLPKPLLHAIAQFEAGYGRDYSGLAEFDCKPQQVEDIFKAANEFIKKVRTKELELKEDPEIVIERCYVEVVRQLQALGLPFDKYFAGDTYFHDDFEKWKAAFQAFAADYGDFRLMNTICQLINPMDVGEVSETKKEEQLTGNEFWLEQGRIHKKQFEKLEVSKVSEEIKQDWNEPAGSHYFRLFPNIKDEDSKNDVTLGAKKYPRCVIS